MNDRLQEGIMRISAKDTICLVIDYQERLIPSIGENELLLENSRKLLLGLKLLKIPFLVTQQYTKGLGATVSEIADILDMPATTSAMDKITFSAWENEPIRKALENQHKRNVIVCGTEAHICVLQTLIDLQNNGYQVILPTDCIGSRKEIDKAGAIQRSLYEGALLTTYEALLFELTQVAGTEVFRQLVKIIK